MLEEVPYFDEILGLESNMEAHLGEIAGIIINEDGMAKIYNAAISSSKALMDCVTFYKQQLVY